PPSSLLFPYTTLFRSRIADVRNHGNRGLDDVAQPRDLPRNARPGLDDQRFRILRRRQNRERYTDQIVEVRGGGMHAIARAERRPDRKSTRLNSSHVAI